MQILIPLFIFDFRTMSNKIIYSSTISLFFLIITLPFLQTVFGFLPEARLIGFTKDVDLPSFSLSAWYDKSLQTGIEDYFDQNLGLKGALIKTDNQINFSLFNEIHQKTNSKIIVGGEDYLFENNYIKSYIGRDYREVEILEERIISLAKLQEQLTEAGKAFVFLIAPSKASFYKEHIPPELIYRTADKDPENNYERIIPLLNKYKINYFDGREYLLAKKEDSPYPLFPKGGTHWTRYASCFVSNEIIQEAGIQLNKEFVFSDCNDVDVSGEPSHEDGDLIDLANLWNKKR